MRPARAKPMGTPVCFSENTMPNHSRGTRWASTCAEAGLIGPCAAPMNMHGDHRRRDQRQRIEGKPDGRHQQRGLADAHRAQPHDRPGRGQRQRRRRRHR